MSSGGTTTGVSKLFCRMGSSIGRAGATNLVSHGWVSGRIGPALSGNQKEAPYFLRPLNAEIAEQQEVLCKG